MRSILSLRISRSVPSAARGLKVRKGSSSSNTGTFGSQHRGILTESWAKGPSSVCILPKYSISFANPLATRCANTFPPSQPPLLTQTIPQNFESIVSQHGDRAAVISRSQKERLTYRELDERSNALARGLRAQGVGKGDRVAVSLGNNWEFAVVTYAVWKLGAILVRF